MMHLPRSAGFTLIESIIVIVIIGVLSAAVAVFIRAPVQGYIDSVRRAELTDTADVALRRITRDVRLALPNSLRVSGDCIEFIMTSSGGRYRDPADGSTGGNFLRFTADTNPCGSNLCFDVLGDMPAMAANDFMVVYNLGTGGANAYAGGNRAVIQAVAGNTVTLTSNPFASQSPPLPSPNARFQIVPAATQAVSYVCSGGELRRYAGYGFNAAQACPPTGTGALLAGSATAQPKAACVIDYASAATGRSGLLYLQLTLTDTPSGEAVTLFQQIHVDNAP